MHDVDQWIEIAKDCKYLPENDLKVLRNYYIKNKKHPKHKLGEYLDIFTLHFIILETM